MHVHSGCVGEACRYEPKLNATVREFACAERLLGT